MDKASVILPIYNQYNSLIKVLHSFSRQTMPKDAYELIVVDDGSDDILRETDSEELRYKYDLNITVYHQENGGRAAARNRGIELSDNELIIFCDADRVPCPDFVKLHLQSHSDENTVIIGEQYDIFYKNIDSLFDREINWSMIKRFSKKPDYYSRISRIYNDNVCIAKNFQWMSFLVGNSSVSKNLLCKTGFFDEDFKKWGFEHFELGLRLQYNNAEFKINKEAVNYHIPHLRDTYFYSDMINDSAFILKNKHPEINTDVMKTVIMNDVEICEFNNCIFER